MHGPTTSTKTGFQGSIGSLPLADLLQVWSMNRFAGLVTVSYQSRFGQLYFVAGQIVHAEVGGLIGESALHAMIAWPAGDFELSPNTTTLHRTIDKTLSHLLLDAHRVLDEQRRSPPPATGPRLTAVPPVKDPPRPSALDQIRGLPGVTRVVRFGKDGRPVRAEGPQADHLAAIGLYLAVTQVAAVAAAFGLGELSIASLQGERESFAVVHKGGNYLCVAVAAGTPVEPIVGQLRALLTRTAAA